MRQIFHWTVGCQALLGIKMPLISNRNAESAKIVDFIFLDKIQKQISNASIN